VASVPQQHVRLRIEQVVAGGDGLAREASGRVVFVPGVLPGEEVAVRLVTAKRDFARGELVEVLTPAPARVSPPCAALRRGCGGCDWQHAGPAQQAALKLEVVREALRRTARMPDVDVIVGGSVPSWAYRTSMRVAVDRVGRVSLRRPRTNEPVPLDHCLVAHPLLDELVHGARFVGADEVSLRVSAATGERSVWWTTARPGDRVVPEGLGSDVTVGSDAVVHEVVAGRRYRVSGESFFQSGPAAAELLVDTVRELGGDTLAGARTVLDAYGGIGLFAGSLATTAPDATFTVVEGSAAACADAAVNLADLDAEVVCSPVETWTPSPVDVAIADPSRHGLGRDATAVLVATGAPMLLLVGCDPVAFARDAALLGEAGYRLARATVVDLFPQTHHVEVVGRFDRNSFGRTADES
jgi:23S rRNA (uracil1939-C5)-methyltransferase